MKTIKILVCAMTVYVSGCGSSLMHAQSSFDEFKRRASEQFEQYRAEKHKEFADYRARVNREYEEYMRRAWREYEAAPAIPVPPSPEPPLPEVAPPDTEPDDSPLPFANVTPVPAPAPEPVPLLPDEGKDQQPDMTPGMTFGFYGSTCRVAFDVELRFALRSTDENSVADAWRKLSGPESVALVKSCVALRDSLHLSDWGYLRLVEKMADTAFGIKSDESVLMQMFVLAQSGYKVRIGRGGKRLIMLVPSDEIIYNHTYISIDGAKYYVADRDAASGSVQVFDRKFPNEQVFSLRMGREPLLAYEAAPTRRFKSKFTPEIDLDLAVNKNLVDFYNDYPLSNHWDLYAGASLSEAVKSRLYPVLRASIDGRSQRGAVNVLLHFVQTAFEYMTDGDQFGIERPLFADESFFYPYNDCEDRAILFSVLVRDLTGLDVVLLHYPGHLAAAVGFDEPVSGNYFEIDSKRYTVCDPTYINADVGMAMPQFKSTGAEIIRL